MKIRKATRKDLNKIAELFRIEFSKSPYNEKWSIKDSITKIKDYFKDNIILVAEDEKEILGFLIGNIFLWWDGKRGFIDEIVVANKSQGKGIGKSLIQSFENYLKNKKIKRLSLMSVKSSKAFNIYKKLKFIEEDYVSMYKSLK